MHVFEAKFHGEALTEAEPCFRFVRVVELLPRKLELTVSQEAGVEPEVEGAALVVSGHVAGRRLEEDPGVAPQHRAVGGLHPQHVRGGVVRGLAVDLNTSVWITIETSAVKRSRAFSWLKAPTSAFTFKTLLETVLNRH